MRITIVVKHNYWFISRVSGERLQDHWSSGIIFTHRWRLLNFKLALCALTLCQIIVDNDDIAQTRSQV